MASMLKNMIRMGMLPDNNQRNDCPKQEQSFQPESNPCQEPVPYVSTPLDIHYADTSQPNDITIDGTIFRKLSPDYFAWFRSRMVSAQAAHKAGKLSGTAWETLRERFNNLQEMAIEIFGKETLQQALRDFNLKSYTPPVPPRSESSHSAEPARKDWLYPAGQA